MRSAALLSVLVVCLLCCSLPSTLSQGTRNTYDFIIVGAGSAGSTVTGELAVKFPGSSFLIIEAGGDATDPMVHNTLVQGDLLNSTFTYLRDDQTTQPAPDYFNYQILVNRGKMTAGSMGVNAMFYVVGDPYEWDTTANDIGDQSWSWSSTNKYRNRIPQEYSLYKFDNKQLGGKQYIRAFNNAGWTYDTDATNGINGITNSFQIAYLNPSRPGGVRETSFERKISSQKLANVELLTFHRVSKVLIDSNKKAYGVQVVNLRSNATYQFGANKEVILSGGAFRTPQILQLSGVGPAAVLQAAGIPVVLNAPGVGANLNDHLGLHAYWQSLLPVQAPILYNLPNFQFFGPRATTGGPQYQMEISSGFTSVLPLRMELGGTVNIASSDPLANPLVNYPITLAYEDAMVYGAQNILFPVINQLRAQNVTGIGFTPVQPGATDDAIRGWLRETMVTNFHPCCTARVGAANDNNAVVDSHFRVKGIQNLRVVDASVHRHLPSGNINAPTLLLGYFAADRIAQDHGYSNDQGNQNNQK